MAEIKMSYIFIEKQKYESKILKEVLLEIFIITTTGFSDTDL